LFETKSLSLAKNKRNMMSKSFLVFCVLVVASRGAVSVTCPSPSGVLSLAAATYSTTRYGYCDLGCNVNDAIWDGSAGYSLDPSTKYTVKCRVKCSSKPNGEGAYELRSCYTMGISGSDGGWTITTTTTTTAASKSLSLQCPSIGGASKVTSVASKLLTSPKYLFSGWDKCSVTSANVNGIPWNAETSDFYLPSGQYNTVYVRVDCKSVDGSSKWKSCSTSATAPEKPFMRATRGFMRERRGNRHHFGGGLLSRVAKGVVIPVVGELISRFGNAGLDALLNAPSTSISQPSAGAVWITNLNGGWLNYNGQVISCYYHPTKTHTASTKGKLGLKRSTASPGEWAISIQTRALFGNKAYYNDL
jgi:hypothetical protein